ncbi:hypothetical protein [Bosea sp. (in: a-proteobacteria)]|uniref:hypothetical protein n=1 Tax=Bosea sp. (in: a-proteobacteria) TaxID=1871050 RepID=UPI003B3B96D8
MSAVPVRAMAGEAPNLSITQRLALRMMHGGALIRGATGTWTTRAFPHQPVRSETVRSLVGKGLAEIRSYRGLYEVERECAVLTFAGERERRGLPAFAVKAPPVAAEVVLREVEGALAILAAEQEKMQAEILQDSAAIRDGRQDIAKIEMRLAAAENRLNQRMEAAETLRRRRVELAALVDHACRRLGQELAEAGR